MEANVKPSGEDRDIPGGRVFGRGGMAAVRRRAPRLALFAACGLESMSYGAVYALLAQLQRHYHLPTWGLGTIAGATFAAQLVAQLTVARYADRGRARRMLQGGVALAALGVASFGFSSELWQFVCSRLLLGLGSGIFLPAALRVVVAQAGDETGAAMGRLMSVQVGGFVLGPPVGALMSATLGLRAPFFLQSFALLCCVPLLRLVVEPPVVDEHPPSGAIRRLLRLRSARAGLAVAAGTFVTMGTFEAIWARFMTDRGASPMAIAISVSVFALPLVFLAPRGGKLADRAGPMRVAILALLALAGLQTLYAIPGPYWFFLTFSFAMAMVISTCLPAGGAAMAEASPEDLVGAGQGLYGAVGAGTAAIASVSAAVLYGALGTSAMWLIVASATLIGALAARHAAGPLRTLGPRLGSHLAIETLAPAEGLLLTAAPNELFTPPPEERTTPTGGDV